MNTESKRWTLSLLLALAVAVAGVAGSDDDDDDDELEFQVRGSGTYLLTTSGGSQIEVSFALHAEQDDDEAEGRFRQSLEFQGLPIEFHGRVTCLAVDPANGRVWVGGVVTQNLSVNPLFTREIHEPGKDVWFRVLDTGRGSVEPDRSTFLGFEGGAGIVTSEEYCNVQPWPDNNERTHPVIDGKIKLKLDDD